jgi:hypothetical protein
MTPTDGKSNGDPIGGKIKTMLDAAPDTMAELMRQFIESKDLNTRVKIRLRMKALLDLVAVDTVYPKLPARDMDQGRGIGRGRPYEPMVPALQGPMDVQAEMDHRVGEGVGGGVLPVPGAEAIQNDDVLG